MSYLNTNNSWQLNTKWRLTFIKMNIRTHLSRRFSHALSNLYGIFVEYESNKYFITQKNQIICFIIYTLGVLPNSFGSVSDSDIFC